ncbi:MAG: glycosyltransferase family 2 protein [Candidatus Aureabacteria bacterium]|nr:glycosyltransferase family 2 protein [Candidatus Auribacterota bacterium]
MLFIILPAYNEAGCIVPLLQSISRVMKNPFLKERPWKVLVIDDGSTDGTREKALSMAGGIDLEVIRHPGNFGVDRAFLTGFTKALQYARDEDLILTMDADNTHQPQHIEELVRKIEEGYDVVVASRYRPHSMVKEVPPGRLCLSWMARIILTALFHAPGIRDYTIFYRIYRPAALRRAFAYYGDKLFEAPGFTSMAELLIKLNRLPPPRIRFAETSCVLLYGIKLGPSKMKILKNISEYVKMIIRFKLGL